MAYGVRGDYGIGRAFGIIGPLGVKDAPSGPVYPALLRISQITSGQDFQSTINNDGSLWFWGGGGPGTMQCVIANEEPDAVVSAEILVESREATSGPLLGWAVQVAGVWASDTTDITPAAGGSLASPTVSPAPEITMPTPVAQGGTFRMHVVQGDGLLTAAKTFSEGYWPTGNLVTGANFNAGDHLTDIPGAFVGIGAFQSRAILKHSPGSLPKCVYGMFGDSTSAMVASLAYSPNTSKEGVWYRGNLAAIAAGKRVRAYSYGQGGASASDIRARVRANLATMAGRVNVVGVMVATWNTPIEGVAAADAEWAEYLTLEAEVQAAGLICVPYILHPYTTRNSVDQAAGWTQMQSLVAAHPLGLDFSDITGSTSFPDLVPAESLDNIHMDPPGATRCGPLIMDRLIVQAETFYPELA